MKTFRQAIREATDEVKLNLRDRIKLRFILLSRPQDLEEEILAHAMAEGVVPAGSSLDSGFGEIDWQAWLEFIKVALPIVLQLITLFT